MFDGDLGVRFFFVISGFLITWLMLLEHDRHGKVSLKAFYIRRALRILPVYFGFILCLAALQYFTKFSQSTAEWVGNLTFTTNFFGGNFTSEHLWSLSTEEQFYLLWPGLFVLLSIAKNFRFALRVLLIPVLAAPFCRVMGYTQHPVLLAPVMRHFSFFAYFDSLAIGCAGAIILSRRKERVKEFFDSHRNLTLIVGTLLILVPYCLTKMRWVRPLTVPLAYSSQGFGFGLLLLLSITHPNWGAFRALNWTWVRQIGILSYSIYIWQQLFCSPPDAFGWNTPWWMSFPGWLVPVFALGFASYYGFERPFLKLRAKFRKGYDNRVSDKG